MSVTREAVEQAKSDFALVSEFFPAPWKPDERTNWIWTASLKGGHAHMADVRGWGYLTGGGQGALNLDANEAAKIQDAIGRLIATIPGLLTALQAREEENAEVVETLVRLERDAINSDEMIQRLEAALAEALGACRVARDFAELEIENRGYAGGEMTDYQDEAQKAFDACDAMLSAIEARALSPGGAEQ